MSRSSAAARIRKLLDLARDQEGTPEGETAARIARRLMRQTAHARAKEWSQRGDITVSERTLDLGARWPWRRRLASAVARHCACVAAWPPRGTTVVLFGAVGTLDIAEYLLAVLLREIDEARADWLSRQDDHDPMEPLSPDLARRTTGFCNSAVGAVEARLRELRRQERDLDPDGHALVHDEAASVRRWMDDQGIQLKKGAPDPFAFSADGWTAGHGIALHDAVSGRDGDPNRRLRQQQGR